MQFDRVLGGRHERKRLEAALRASEEHVRLITRVMSDYTFSTNYREPNFFDAVQISGAFQAITGYTVEEFYAVGGWEALLHPDDVEIDRQDRDKLALNQRAVSEVRIITKGGAVRWVRVYANPVWDEKQKCLTGITGAVQDITERKITEQALRQSEQRHRIVSSIISDYAYAYEVEPDGSFHTGWITEESFRRLTGYDWDEIKHSYNLYHPDDVERAHRDVQRTIAGEETSGEYRIITRSGDVRWVYISRQAERDATGRVIRFYGAAQDITEEKRLETELQQYATSLEMLVEERTAQLRRAKEQIEIVLDHTADAVALIQSNGDIKTKNPAFVDLFGDHLSHCIERILWVVADDPQRTLVGEALLGALHDQTPHRVEAQIVTQTGEGRDFDLAFVPVHLDDEADQHGLLVSAHDITSLKAIERFKERFVADALHDMATPIMGLTTRLYLLRRSPEKLDDHVRALENQVHHLRNLLSDLRMLSQMDRGELALTLEPYDLNQLVRRVFDTYEPVAINKHQLLRLTMDEGLPLLVIDSRQIERALVNLISNAINYTPEGKTITLETRFDAGIVVFTVEDQGMGIDPVDLPRIFERFYRTQQARVTQAGGTGLGLAIVKEIVELHGGSVSAESELGRGSVFIIRLPQPPR